MLISVTRLNLTHSGTQPLCDEALVRVDDIILATTRYPDDGPPHTLLDIRGSYTMAIAGDVEDLQRQILFGHDHAD